MISKESAQLANLNPGSIQALTNRIENGEDPAQVIAEAITSVQAAPGVIGRITGLLRDLIMEEKLEFSNGTFVAVDALNEEDAKRIITQTVALNNGTEGVGNMGRWVLGNIVTILEDQGYSIGDFVEPTQLAYNTIATSAKTFREFNDVRFKLPFAHHKEIAYCKDLTKEAKHAVLKYAEANGTPVKMTRNIASILQDQVRRHEPIENLEKAVEEAANKANEQKTITAGPVYHLINPEGIQTIHRLPTEQEIEAATHVIKGGRMLKEEPEQGAGRGAEEVIPEAVQTNDADGGTAHGEHAE